MDPSEPTGNRTTGRLSILAAAYVVARRDFVAILFSRSFLFFLIGPLFLALVTGVAGGIGVKVQESAQQPLLGVAMSQHDTQRMLRAQQTLTEQLGSNMPELVVVKQLAPGETIDPAATLKNSKANLAAIVTGTPQHPVLTGSAERISSWQGRVGLLAAQALEKAPVIYPEVELVGVATATRADQTRSRAGTAQIGQGLLFMLTMLLAGMVLSNLVEEKGNKIIEVLAAAIPMDAVFLGKLFAMLAVSMVGISVWAMAGSAVWLTTGHSLGEYPAPAVGWPMFFALGVVYFSMGYLLLGSVFLAIGSLASTVREVQTLSMPVTMLQLLNFFFASFATAQPGSWIEKAAMIMPFSSPFTMLARAAQDGALWPHLLAIGWQLVCVSVLIKLGAALFRKRVMQSGPQRGKKRRFWHRRPAPAAPANA